MPSLSLRKSKPLDASGVPIDPTATYEAISSHARGHRVFNAGYVLRGDDPDVLTAPQLWVRESATTPEKRAARAAHIGARRAEVPPGPVDPSAPRILGLIPPERRRRALRNYHDKAGHIVHEGSVWDANDDFVKANPDMFGPEAA